jgi:hypothetical protein
MTQEEIVKEIKQLPAEDREALLEAITQIVQDEAPIRKPRAPFVEKLRGIAKPNTPSQISAGREDPGEGHLSLSQQLYGILEFENGPPTDDEVKDMIADSLIEKYS